MYRLSSIILLVALTLSLSGQSESPHGNDFKMDCAACHTADSWDIPSGSWDFQEPESPKRRSKGDKKINIDTLPFNHYNTDFALEGQHASIDCKQCHDGLVFTNAETDCISCHIDVHQQSVGFDCARCHALENWLVDNISDLHMENGFPLLGAHAVASCDECHTGETNLQFYSLGNECLNCHQEDYAATTDPNHAEAGYSLECLDCHEVNAFDWSAENIIHDFFPLIEGHNISDCGMCHTGYDFTFIPPTDCFECHQVDYEMAENPNHEDLNFTTNCASCHTLAVDWMPATYLQHDNEYFPIYSGTHGGEWSQCTDCHTNPANYAEFTCVTCHTRPETDGEHNGVGGYIYESGACLACHPNGDEGGAFNHNETNFPLTGGHISVDCIECHANGYAGTPTECVACHLDDYNQTTDPNHVAEGLPTNCAVCHNEQSWEPSIFDHNQTAFPLHGAHVSADCIDCHADGYEGTPTDCFACHEQDYNNTTDPNHSLEGFSTECAVCHSENAWEPAVFDHNQTAFPLNGAHISVDCIECHADGYEGTPTDCFACHEQDFNNTTDPDHSLEGFTTDCAMCHSENAWEPANFDHSQTDFPLNGAHASVDCNQCHVDGFEGTPTNCFACHEQDYNQANNPNHSSAGFPIECESCHSETAWTPSTFDHDGMYFPIYSGNHNNEWDDCNECHTTPGNFTAFSCIDCHEHNDPGDMADEHDDEDDYQYSSPACYSCHPNGD